LVERRSNLRSVHFMTASTTRFPENPGFARIFIIA
jgi:hypothetical protein